METLDLFQIIAGQGPGMTFALVILYIMIRDKKEQGLRDVALTEAIHKLAMEIQALRYMIIDEELLRKERGGQRGTPTNRP